MQGPRLSGDCYPGIIRIQTTSTGLSPAETITLPNPSSVFLLYANYGFLYTAHQPYLFLTYNSTSINWIYLSGLVLSPLRTTSHIVLEDILLSLHSHAIDNEHSALVPWTYNLFDCRQLLPPTSGLVASMSGLAFISPLCIHASPLYFGGHDYRPHGSLATAATRSSVLLFLHT